MSADNKREQTDDQLIVELRTALRHASPIPPGLIARLHAGVSRARKASERFTTGERTVLGAIAFTAIAHSSGSSGIVAAFVAAVVYATALNSIDRAPRKTRVSS